MEVIKCDQDILKKGILELLAHQWIDGRRGYADTRAKTLNQFKRVLSGSHIEEISLNIFEKNIHLKRSNPYRCTDEEAIDRALSALIEEKKLATFEMKNAGREITKYSITKQGLEEVGNDMLLEAFRENTILHELTEKSLSRRQRSKDGQISMHDVELALGATLGSPKSPVAELICQKLREQVGHTV